MLLSRSTGRALRRPRARSTPRGRASSPLPAILPALTSQYLNLAKNSTLAIAVGYADLYAVSDTTITQTGRAIEGFLLLLISFLLLNLLISGAMAGINRAVLGRLRRSR